MPERKRHAHLREAGLSTRTLRSYKKAVRNFFHYLREFHGGIPPSAGDLDRLVGEFLNLCWQEGEPIGYAGRLLSGLQRFHPPLRRCLPTGQQYFKNWQREHVPNRVTPLPVQLLKAMGAAAWLGGHKDLSVILVLGFSCFLRTMEMITLTVQDVQIFAERGVIHLALPATKTTRYKLAMESLIIDEPVLVTLLSRLVHGREAEERLFSGDGRVFRQLFRRLLTFFKVEGFNFQPYSIRRGGATWWFDRSGSLDQTVVRGRWQDAKTCRIYLDDARAALTRLTFSPDSNRLISMFEKSWSKIV